ncbi:5-oxoprolinase subunit PxpB [Labrys monachus]|uniref:KipI family sensor histidine kinase inhibitor n=1 Tax=Labrys monachus TaxID=217067 RepID=A0ABU0FH22_9HYPH|nr:5-oxoprolinase subunit PxpB [Labrys monachus]MDQ0393875.1 KipI family sensor histidine kinase inhibitor [Labrys monachus]
MTSHHPATLVPRFLNAGDGGLTVEFGSEISETVNIAVIALGDRLAARNPPGLLEIIPTYRSLLLLFDPVVLPRKTLMAEVEQLWSQPHAPAGRHTRWHVPVLYGGEAGIDLGVVAGLHGMTQDEVVALHAGADYRVYMIGFAPGFAYLGGLPAAIHTSRRTDPRMKIPSRSISIGGQQTAVGPPLEIPSGWQLIGRTPAHSYDPTRTQRPFLFQPGDTIRFEPISESLYGQLRAAALAGELVARPEDVDG